MFLAVFRNRKRIYMDRAAYAADAQRMADLASVQPGYLAFKSYTAEDGEVIAVSECANEASARAWGRHVEHGPVQGRGRSEYYESYTLSACSEPRIHHFERSPR
jgi:heme-degrading monooxygenase HmoA